eukprot:365861-Chlamydomonas_euryale.AAC.28
MQCGSPATGHLQTITFLTPVPHCRPLFCVNSTRRSRDHQSELMSPQALPRSVLALAGVARHLLDVRAAAAPLDFPPAASLVSASLLSAANPSGSGSGSAAARANTSSCSPWDRADSKRLWGRATRAFAPMQFPEGGPNARADVRLEVRRFVPSPTGGWLAVGKADAGLES